MSRHDGGRSGGGSSSSRSGGGFKRPHDDDHGGWRGNERPSTSMAPSSSSLVTEERLTSDSDATAVYANPYLAMSVQQQRQRLTIYKSRTQILYLCERVRTLVLVGETGCGKSTQLPQYLMEAGWCTDGRQIAVTQPRRVAAVTLAARVAEEAGCRLGTDVGYAVRFDDVTDAETKIKYMTDGLLLRELLTDPLLTRYSVVMVDEAHERTLSGDILLGLLKKLLRARPDLLVIVSSATLDAELFRDYFELNETADASKNTSEIISVEGRTHPVTVFYAKTPLPNVVAAACESVLEIHKTELSGDLLVFLAGQDEIDECCSRLLEEAGKLRHSKKYDRLDVVPLHGALPAKEQLRAFDSTPHGVRKVVVATNIAEASVTIPGIAYVIDSGFVKIRALSTVTGLESLMRVAISQAAAEQRAGRAGRVRPGKAYRLYTEDQFHQLLPAAVPEVQRCELSPLILQLKALGVQNVARFDYISRPPASSMVQSLEILYALGALDSDGLLTNPVGVQIADCPLAPMHAKCLIASGSHRCSEEMVTILAMLQIQDVFVAPARLRHRADVVRRKFAVQEGDPITLLNVYTAYVDHNRNASWCSQNFINYRGLCRADAVRAQLVRLLKRFGVPLISSRGELDNLDRITRCLVSGFFANAAYYANDGLYHTVRGEHAFQAYKGSVVMFRKEFPKWVVFCEVMANSIRDLTVIEPQMLYELAPHFYENTTEREHVERFFGPAAGPPDLESKNRGEGGEDDDDKDEWLEAQPSKR